MDLEEQRERKLIIDILLGKSDKPQDDFDYNEYMKNLLAQKVESDPEVRQLFIDIWASNLSNGVKVVQLPSSLGPFKIDEYLPK